jgi:EipB-like
VRQAFLGASIFLAMASVAVASPINLLSHRAQYDVTLASTQPGGVVAVRGRTVLEFRDACTGWTTTQRFIADMTDGKAQDLHSDYVVSSSEDKDGKIIRFKIRNLVNGHTMQRFEGTGTLAAAGGQVMLTAPRGQHFDLPGGTLLPTQHTLAVLRAAAAGIHAFHETVFQGGDSSDLYDTATVIGRPSGKAQLAQDRAADAGGLLTGVAAWPTLVSYFPHGSSDERADYEIAYRLYANGVIASMTLIYPNFTMKAELVRLEKLPAHC